MKITFQAFASLVLASAIAGQAYAADGPAAATLPAAGANAAAAGADAPAARTAAARKKRVRVRKSAKPTVQAEIEALRSDLTTQRTQIDALQQQLSSRDAQLQQVQTQAQQAIEQATEQGQSAIAAQQAVNAQNTTAVAALQSSVTDLQGNTASIATTIQQDQTATKKAIENPDSIHFKGVTLSPTGSFIEFATVNRTRAEGADINAQFTGIPYTASDAGRLSEFFATARQSRLALYASGKVGTTAVSGYYEADFLSAGATSNNNQSNSYTLRERQLWAQAAFHSGLTLTGGSQWTLATENAHGIDNRTEVLPQTIDSQYQVGFVWARQPGFRATYRISPRTVFGISAEQAQLLAPSCTASAGGFCAVNYLAGQSGNSGGLYNGAGVPAGTSTGGQTINVVNGTVTLPTTDVVDGALANYSYNVAPDLLAKVAIDLKNTHIEAFGIEREFRNRVYPNVNPQTGRLVNANLPGGAGAYNDTQIGGGAGGSVRQFLLAKKIDVGVKGQYGDGTSRYATSQLPDVTTRPDGQFAVLHNFSAMGFTDINPTPRLSLYGYYGTDYVFRTVFADGTGTGQSGYGSHLLATATCGVEPAPGTTVGGSASTGPTNGFSPTVANCPVNNKDIREATAGFWYDFYKGPMGRLREGFQYSWIERNTYTGLNRLTPTAIDNEFETSLRYYLP